MNTKNYDIIIIGAGLAGLSLGSELSKKYDILVIEKGQIKNEHKTWTTEESIIKDVGLKQFITARFNKCYFKFLKKNRFYVHDKMVTVDDVGILDFFAQMIKKNNQSKIIENCGFLDIIEKNENNLTIDTTKGLFSSRLIIDCSGARSLLVAKYQLYNKIFYYPVYGGIYNVQLKDEDANIAEIMTSDFPTNLFEIFPANKN